MLHLNKLFTKVVPFIAISKLNKTNIYNNDKWQVYDQITRNKFK